MQERRHCAAASLNNTHLTRVQTSVEEGFFTLTGLKSKMFSGKWFPFIFMLSACGDVSYLLSRDITKGGMSQM